MTHVISGTDILRTAPEELRVKALAKAQYYLSQGFKRVEIDETHLGEIHINYRDRDSNRLGESV